MTLSNKPILVPLFAILLSIAAPVHAQTLNEPADLVLTDVISAINFGTTTDQVIGGVVFRAATANSTVGGVKNTAMGTVGVNQYKQTLPELGSTKDDNALEQILGTSIFGQSGNTSIKVALEIPSGFYRAQLLIYDGWQSVTGNKRDVNHYVEGILAAGHYHDFAEQNGTPDAGSIASYVFEVIDGKIDLSIEGLVPNAHLSGVVISKLPSLNAADLKPADKLVQRSWPPAIRPRSNPTPARFAKALPAKLNHIRQPYSEEDVKPLIKSHCYRCHNKDKQKGDIRLDNLTLDFARERELWDKVEKQIVTNVMPPKKPFLSDDQRLKITDWIKTQEGKVDWSAHRQAGHVTLPMLNRIEYANTVRALFNDDAFDSDLTHIDFFKALSDDGVGDTGFSSDRDSPSLAMTSSRMEKYIRITEDVLEHYLYTDNPIVHTDEAEEMKATTAVLTPTKNGVMIKANRDSLYTRWHYPRTGWYVLNVKAWGERVDNRACAEMVIYLDRKEVGQVRLLATRAQPGDYHCLVWIEKGHHTLRFRPQRAGMTMEESRLPVPSPFPDKPVIADFNDLGLGTGVYMCLDKIEIRGPVNQLPGDFNRNDSYTEGSIAPPTRSIITQQNTPAAERGFDLAWEKQTKLTINREVSDEEIPDQYTDVWVKALIKTDFSTPPQVAMLIAADGDGRGAARQVISRFVTRAFRRPVIDRDIDFFLQFYDADVASSADHRSGLSAALFAIMISPDFFYRIPPIGSTTAERRLGSFEMASRLSYFLWNSMPDEELFALAEADELTDPEVVDLQVVRMLQSPKGKRMLAVFAREWLGYRELGVTIKPDDALFNTAYYASNIEGLFKKETDAFVNYIFAENRPLEELITADYAFWNRDLAQYYGEANALPGTATMEPGPGWNHLPHHAIDGNRATFSQSASPIWDLKIDLHQVYPIDEIQISPTAGVWANAYTIKASTDNESWTTIYTASNADDQLNIIEFDMIDARYIWMDVAGVGHEGNYGHSIHEFEVLLAVDQLYQQLADDLMKVQLSDNSSRGGLLGMGSILSVTSHPTRTSAVDRGLWVYEKLFGKHLPDPPIVPALEEAVGEAGAARTFRQVLEKHREDQQCASCHNLIDPIGFGLENFDPIGRWRKFDRGTLIDATGVLPDGGTFEGPNELKRQLVRSKTDFYRNMAQTVLTYALGRKLEFYDRPEVDKIVEHLLATGGQSHELLKMVARSYPFTHASSDKGSEESK